MSDPIEDLEHFNQQGIDVNPLPAAEVRRRGTRMRRRNNALAAVAGVAAIAIVAVPLGLSAAGGGGDRTTPQPAGPSPSRTSEPAVVTDWLQEVPATFPLTEGFPARNASDGSPVTTSDQPGLADVTVCGVPAWSATADGPVRAADAVGVTYAGESEDSRARTLAVYVNDHAAEQAFAGLRVSLEDCPVDRTGTGAPQQYDVVPADLGDEAFTFTQRSRDGSGFLGDLATYQVVRVGNALYLATYYGQGGADRQVIDHTLQLMADDSAPVVSDLCLFAAEPCGPGDGDPSEASGSGGPESVATSVNLTAGYPSTNGDDGSPVRTTGTPGVETLTFCGATAFDPGAAAGVAGAAYSGEAEDFRGRTLAVYDDVAAARAALATLRTAVEACPSEDLGGTDQVYEPVDLPAGDESFTFTHRFRTDGNFDVGLQVISAVRVGRAVYVASTFGEGGGSPATIDAVVAQLGTDSQGVVDQLCRFTAEGC